MPPSEMKVLTLILKNNQTYFIPTAIWQGLHGDNDDYKNLRRFDRLLMINTWALSRACAILVVAPIKLTKRTFKEACSMLAEKAALVEAEVALADGVITNL